MSKTLSSGDKGWDKFIEFAKEVASTSKTKEKQNSQCNPDFSSKGS